MLPYSPCTLTQCVFFVLGCVIVYLGFHLCSTATDISLVLLPVVASLPLQPRYTSTGVRCKTLLELRKISVP